MVKGGERVDRGLPHGSAGTESTCDAGNTGYSPKGRKELVTPERLGMRKHKGGQAIGRDWNTYTRETSDGKNGGKGSLHFLTLQNKNTPLENFLSEISS